jgi:hypothetical protein
MKLNWTLFKVVFAFLIIFGTVAWALVSLLPTTFNGTAFDFEVGTGTVTMTNPTNVPVPVQLVGTRSRSFTVVSSTEGMAGSSTRDRDDNNSVYTFAFDLPAGVSDFTIARSANVRLVADTTTQLEARVNPLSADSVRTTLIAAGVVILGALFYASNATGHRWVDTFRRQHAASQDAQPTTASRTPDKSYSPYGDNRAAKPSKQDQTNSDN